MKPSLAKHLVDAFVAPGGKLLDPFGGVGTIPFEAACAGVTAWSFDISPVAIPVATAKLSQTSEQDCHRILDNLQHFFESNDVSEDDYLAASEVKFNGPLSSYFHEATFEEILKARKYFQKNPPLDAASALVFASLLHVLHGNRPYALSRRSHPITPFSPTGESEYKSVIQKVADKIERTLGAERPDTFIEGTSLFQDATTPWPVNVDQLDAVITSPPFYDSTRFYLANWMRLWMAGWNTEDFKKQPASFVDERQKASFDVYKPILRQARERLKSGGVFVLHLGKSNKCDMAVEIEKVARSWFSHSEIFAESVAHCESHGISDKGAVEQHTYLVLH